MRKSAGLIAIAISTTVLAGAAQTGAPGRPRARDPGIAPGIFAPGSFNAITDVAFSVLSACSVVDQGGSGNLLV